MDRRVMECSGQVNICIQRTPVERRIALAFVDVF